MLCNNHGDWLSSWMFTRGCPKDIFLLDSLVVVDPWSMLLPMGSITLACSPSRPSGWLWIRSSSLGSSRDHLDLSHSYVLFSSFFLRKHISNANHPILWGIKSRSTILQQSLAIFKPFLLSTSQRDQAPSFSAESHSAEFGLQLLPSILCLQHLLIQHA